jgi:hypothetical protein
MTMKPTSMPRTGRFTSRCDGIAMDEDLCVDLRERPVRVLCLRDCRERWYKLKGRVEGLIPAPDL